MLPTSILTEAERHELGALLFPDAASLPSLAELEARFPPRMLPKGAMVVRIAPSPTGFAHIGMIYTSLINRSLAHQSGGVFILRVEDTDSKRLVEGAFETIVDSLELFGQSPDEGFGRGPKGALDQRGAYGPYLQSARRDIYRACTLHLVRAGLAYPCFCTENDLKEMTAQQTAQKMRTGYYGYWATWRDRALAEIKAEVENGTPFVIRLRSAGDPHQRVQWEDGVKGKMALPQNDLDAVILKSDGQSLYHLAHAMDDRFMRITHVIRGDEWVSSVPLHIQIFQAFGWEHPHYSHLSTIQKLDTVSEVDPETGREVVRQSKRKLSKRKDPEANVNYYVEAGYPPTAVVEYLLNIANSDFEDWRRANPLAPYTEFVLKQNKLSPSGALADSQKLASISKEVIGRMSIDTLYADAHRWALRFDPATAQLMDRDPAYARAALNIEREGKKASKRIGSWRDLRSQLAWFYDDGYAELVQFDFPENVSRAVRTRAIELFLKSYDPNDGRDIWFEKCKKVASEVGFAPDMKQFKAAPGTFPGHVGDITNVLRVALTGSRQSPDLCEVMQVLGLERCRARLERWMRE